VPRARSPTPRGIVFISPLLEVGHHYMTDAPRRARRSGRRWSPASAMPRRVVASTLGSRSVDSLCRLPRAKSVVIVCSARPPVVRSRASLPPLQAYSGVYSAASRSGVCRRVDLLRCRPTASPMPPGPAGSVVARWWDHQHVFMVCARLGRLSPRDERRPADRHLFREIRFSRRSSRTADQNRRFPYRDRRCRSPYCRPMRWVRRLPGAVIDCATGERHCASTTVSTSSVREHPAWCPG